jgi:hypothetical protein
MFRLVKNIATVICWLTTLGHLGFDKYELYQIKHLMSDLGHPHIFIAILASARQYLFFPYSQLMS